MCGYLHASYKINDTAVHGWLSDGRIFAENSRWTPVEPGKKSDWRAVEAAHHCDTSVRDIFAQFAACEEGGVQLERCMQGTSPEEAWARGLEDIAENRLSRPARAPPAPRAAPGANFRAINGWFAGRDSLFCVSTLSLAGISKSFACKHFIPKLSFHFWHRVQRCQNGPKFGSGAEGFSTLIPRTGPGPLCQTPLEIDYYCHFTATQRNSSNLAVPDPFTGSCCERGCGFAFGLLLPIPACARQGGLLPARRCGRHRQVPNVTSSARQPWRWTLGVHGGGRLPTDTANYFKRPKTKPRQLTIWTTTVSAWSARTPRGLRSATWRQAAWPRGARLLLCFGKQDVVWACRIRFQLDTLA